MLHKLEKIVISHNAYDNDFFKRSANGTPWQKSDIYIFGPDYYYFTACFPRTLAMLLARIEDTDIQFFLIDILYSELGSGAKRSSHSKLFARLLMSLGLSKQDLQRRPLRLETRRLVSGLRKIYRDEPLSKAMGAQYALERQADNMLKMLHAGFINNPLISEDDRQFFLVHEEDEPEHIAAMSNAIIPYTKSKADKENILNGVEECLFLFSDFWNSLYNELEKSKK